MQGESQIQIIARELAAFESAPSRHGANTILIERPFDHAWIIRPKNHGRREGVDLTLLGVVHGNEVAGLPILNGFLSEVLAAPELLKVSVALILGNPAAARENRRFLDRDLNRSFSRTESETREDRRARAMETVLQKTRFLLDFHQTTEPSETPFFIFPYTPGGYQLARAVAPQFPIVTHWGGVFSKDGQCTDEYVNAKGGTGITLELGQNGMRQEAVTVGLAAARAAMGAVHRLLAGETLPVAHEPARLYTWGKILPFPPSGGNPLRAGWYNFKTVAKGDVLGETPEGVLLAPLDGRILFPKYVRDSAAPRPAELCRILIPIREEELGRT